MLEISWILDSTTGLATCAWKQVEIKGIYKTYVYILRYKRNTFSQLLCAIGFWTDEIPNDNIDFDISCFM